MHYKKNEEGVALITTLLMLGLILVLAMSSILSSTTDIQVSRNVRENTRDLFVADGGIEWFKSQAAYYANYNFMIRNPYTNTLNEQSIVSGSSSQQLIEGLKWITVDGLSASANAKWSNPAETACSAGANRFSSDTNFPLFYTNVDVGARTACVKVFSPVWEGIYATRSDSSGVLYFPRDHLGNYRLNFDGSPYKNTNYSKPNFFALRFPDATSTETVSVSQKAVQSDIRFLLANNLFFFQENPYADPKTCNTSTDVNPDGTCAAYDPNSATVDSDYKPPSSGINPALDAGNSISGVCTNSDDYRVLLVYEESSGTQYLKGLPRRYDYEIDPASTEEDTPYTFMLSNGGTSTPFTDDIGTVIDGADAEAYCYKKTGGNIVDSQSCALTGFKDANDFSYAGFISLVKVGVHDGSCKADIYVPYNDTATDHSEPLTSGDSLVSQQPMVSSWTVSSGKTYTMVVEKVKDYMSELFVALEAVNVAIDSDCTWDAITSTDIYDADGNQNNNGTGNSFDFSVYETPASPDQTVTAATGSIITLNSINVNHDNLEFPQ